MLVLPSFNVSILEGRKVFIYKISDGATTLWLGSGKTRLSAASSPSTTVPGTSGPVLDTKLPPAGKNFLFQVTLLITACDIAVVDYFSPDRR